MTGLFSQGFVHPTLGIQRLHLEFRPVFATDEEEAVIIDRDENYEYNDRKTRKRSKLFAQFICPQLRTANAELFVSVNHLFIENTFIQKLQRPTRMIVSSSRVQGIGMSIFVRRRERKEEKGRERRTVYAQGKYHSLEAVAHLSIKLSGANSFSTSALEMDSAITGWNNYSSCVIIIRHTATKRGD